MIINKNNPGYTKLVRDIFLSLSEKYKYTSVPRFSDIFSLIRDAYGLDGFDLIDHRYIANGPFESYLIDRQIDWLDGKDLNLSDLADSILKVGDFTGREKDILLQGHLEERLWAILLVVSRQKID